MNVGAKKLESSDGENGTILRSLVLSQYQRVTDGQTDTPHIPMSRYSITERDKNAKNDLNFVEKLFDLFQTNTVMSLVLLVDGQGLLFMALLVILLCFYT